MPAPTTSVELLDFIRKSGVLAPAALDQFLETHGPLPDDAKEAARVFLQHRTLTAFQLKLLMAGRYRGFRLGSYLLLDQIGQGGMGAVYLAEHETLRRKAAIKVLPPGGNKLTIERFLREARSAAALDHPNIVRLHEAGREGEIYYLAMEYVDGITLDKFVGEKGPIPAGRAVEFMAQAAAGLQHAYEKGFIHRDIKPGNLILTRDGTIKILDMGLARSTEQNDHLTEMLDSGAVVGTADYISPEQAMNHPDIDIRTDIYSLGATFYAIVAGRPPFEGPTASKLLQHQLKDAPSLTNLDKTFPAKLSAVIARMMAKKPEQRYQTPAELIEAFEPWLGNSSKLLAGMSQTIAGSSGKIARRTGQLGMAKPTKRMDPEAPSADQLDEDFDAETPRRSPRPSKIATKKPSKAIWFAVDGALLMVVVGASVAVWLALNQGDAQTLATTPTQPVLPTTRTESTTPSNPATSPTKPTTPVTSPLPTQPTVVPKGVGPLLKFQASEIAPYSVTRERRNKLEGTGDEKLPKGIYTQSYKPDSRSEFRSEIVDGKPVLSCRNLTELKSAQWVFELESQMGLKFDPKFYYELVVQYRTTGAGFGSALLQNPTPDRRYLKVAELKLPKTEGRWETKTLKFQRPEEVSALRMVIDNLAEGPEDWLQIREVIINPTKELTPVRYVDGASLYKLDGKNLKPVKTVMTAKPSPTDMTKVISEVVSRSGPGDFPPGWSVQTWTKNYQFEGEFAEPGSIAVKPISGAGSAMIFFTPPFKLPSTYCKIRFEYQSNAATDKVTLRYRPDGAPTTEDHKLTSAPNWTMFETVFDTSKAKAARFEFHIQDSSPTTKFAIRNVEVLEATR
jgi:serine/threonine protein kinase